MPFPVNLFACSSDPNSEECKTAKQFFRNLLESIYLTRFIKYPPVGVRPPPGPSPFGGGPQPEPPTISSIIANQNFLIGELLTHALGDPNPQPNRPSLISEIRRSGIQIEVVKGLIKQFENATEALKKELKIIESCK